MTTGITQAQLSSHVRLPVHFLSFSCLSLSLSFFFFPTSWPYTRLSSPYHSFPSSLEEARVRIFHSLSGIWSIWCKEYIWVWPFILFSVLAGLPQNFLHTSIPVLIHRKTHVSEKSLVHAEPKSFQCRSLLWVVVHTCYSDLVHSLTSTLLTL